MKREKTLMTALPTTVLFALIPCLAAGQAVALPPAPAPAAAASGPIVELVKALAWPLVALLVAAVFRRPISVFVSALGSRITKLSLFKVELELLPATAATTTPLLDDIRTATSPATISDSSRAMLEQVQSATPADFAVIAIGEGREWLTTRLYIAAVMMQRMRGVRVFVFVEHSATTDRRLVAVASIRQLRWALARRYPWLEAAWIRALVGVFPTVYMPNAPPLPPGAQWLPDPRFFLMTQQLITSDAGAFEPSQARQLVGSFLESLQRPLQHAGTTQVTLSWTASASAIDYNVKRTTVSGGPYTTVASSTATSYTDNTAESGKTYYYVVTAVNNVGESGNSAEMSATPQATPPAGPTGLPSDPDWVRLSGTLQERAEWVTRDLLASLLPQEAFDAWANALRDAPRARRTRAVLRCAMPFVGLVEGDREFTRLANRQALLEDIATSLGEEPETGDR